MNSASATDSYGVRGAGANAWQASFGMALDELDLLFAVRREPVAHRIVFQVAHDVFDNWFEVEEASEKPDPKFNNEVQNALQKLNAKEVFTRMAVYERLFGWAIIALTYVDYGKDLSQQVVKPREISEILPYSSLQLAVQSSDEDQNPESPRFGLPIYYNVRRGNSGSQTKIHFTRAIHCATRLLDHPYKGMSVLEPIYDDLTVLRNIRWGLGQTISRNAAGFADITFKNAKKKQIQEFTSEQNLRELNTRSYFVHNDDVSISWVGAAGKALDPEPYYLPIMENISSASGIPPAILRGAQAGALTGSEVNEREYFKLISDAQSRYEPAVRQLIDALIECSQIRFKWNVNRGYRIKWLGGFEMNEKDKADVELRLAQARSWSTDWMTINEIRREQGLDPLADAEAGETVLGLSNLKQKGKSSLEKQVEVLPSDSIDSTASSDEADSVVDVGLFERFLKWFRGRVG